MDKRWGAKTGADVGRAMVCVGMLAVLATWALGASKARACDPPWVGWTLDGVVPERGAPAAPVNGVIALRLGFTGEGGASGGWPVADQVLDTLDVRITRDGDEEVEGRLEVDPVLREVRFVSERTLAEGIEYAVEVNLKNSAWPGGGDSLEAWTFTTGDGLDVAPPAFSGVQQVAITEQAQAENDCCAQPLDACPCGGSCQWCWVVGWEYLPVAELTWRAGDDEYGADTVSYVVRRVFEDGSDDAVLAVLRARESGPQSWTWRLPEGDPGPFCWTMEAVDVYGRRSPVAAPVCAERAELVPIERLDVPQPDRSGCEEEPSDDVGPGDDVGGDDAGSDAGGGEDAGGGLDAGSDAAPDASAPDVTAPRGNDDGCGCRTVGAPAPQGSRWGWLICALGVAVWVRRRRHRNTGA